MTNPTPAMFDHMVKVYEQMNAEAREEYYGAYLDEACTQPADPNGNVRVYEGHLTGLFSDLSMSNPYYTHIMKALKTMGCVEQMRRGGGAAKSKWILHYPPTEEGFLAYEQNKPGPRRQGLVAALTQRVKQLEERLTYVEKYLSTNSVAVKSGKAIIGDQEVEAA